MARHRRAATAFAADHPAVPVHRPGCRRDPPLPAPAVRQPPPSQRRGRPSPYRMPGGTLTMTGVGRDDGEFAVPARAAEEAEDLPLEVGDASEEARHRYRDAAVADLDGPHAEQV